MSTKEIDGYLFNEMSEREREKFEERFVENEELFFEVAERENELADQYVNGNLSGEHLSRFELSLASNPARRGKVENAKLLRELIAGQKTEHRTITIAERSGFLSKLGSIFSFGSPAFQFASIGLILILALATVFLLVENRRMNSLQAELATARQREAELSAQIEAERDAASELTSDLTAERERIEKLEAEIARLGRNTSSPQPERPSPSIATLLLLPGGIRGGTAPPKRFDVPKGVVRVAVAIGIPPEAGTVEKVNVRLNGETVAESVRIRVRGDVRTASVTIPATKFKAGRNEIQVTDSAGLSLATYVVAVADRP